jgi:ATP-dependent DNA helicase RecQ
LGRTGLARALQGAGTSPVQPDRFAFSGALDGMTQKRIRKEIARLEDEGLLEPFEKGRYRLLRLTTEGESLLASQDRPLAHRTPAPPDETKIDTNKETFAENAEALYEELRAWRLATAKEAELPAFCVFHNATLRRIAKNRPTTLEQLNAIKGIGPRKLEQYGATVLAVIAGKGFGASQEKA